MSPWLFRVKLPSAKLLKSSTFFFYLVSVYTSTQLFLSQIPITTVPLSLLILRFNDLHRILCMLRGPRLLQQQRPLLQPVPTLLLPAAVA